MVSHSKRSGSAVERWNFAKVTIQNGGPPMRPENGRLFFPRQANQSVTSVLAKLVQLGNYCVGSHTNHRLEYRLEYRLG